ncbi:conserved hypothetical protein [Rippkaea orientalis PCC 8801]|uniref:Glycosyltransferase subfamily 4-like N-terminal domain-containing protein n=1 Tax=Rippkaea orientalis (strain PCC 8801 / RF-1) TaxID=41431 RepID=B7JYC7_RIPO1|nr:glycosyltransferase [Rippkaea orientalis]ACK67229.1 conserved hypothetical protein [Rippkaea orientalis PCC 8801]
MVQKFIIIDHSLCNLQGHHYECSISVAEAADRLGYYPIIVANHTFPKALYHPNIKIIPAFEVDWFNNPVYFKKSSDGRFTWQKILEILTDHPFEKIYQAIKLKIELKFSYWNLTQPKLRVFLEKVQGSTSRLLGWINKDIELLGSIPLSNTLWGIFKIIWGLLRFGFKLITTKINQKLLDLLTPKVSSFSDTLSRVLKALEVTSEDHIFIHTIGIEQVEELYHLLTSDKFSLRPKFHVMLRRDTEEPLIVYAKGMGLKSILEQCYESKLWPETLQFYTDTEDLVQQHNRLSSVIFSQIPIPFRQEKLKASPIKISLDKPINVVYLGDARPEKGYHYLPDVVAALWTDYIQPGKIKFIIQSNFNIEGGVGDIPTARLKLERYPSDKVSLIKQAMSPDDYYQLLGEADLLVLPYDSTNYRIRTSGVLTEALAAGKPVVVPANSWLAKQVDSSRASIYETLDEIPQGIITIVENLRQFTEAAKEFSSGWKQRNSPDSLVKCLLTQTDILTQNIAVTSAPIKNDLLLSKTLNYSVPKILLILEGDCLFTQNHQAKLMIKHIEYLSRCGYEIYALFFPSNQTCRQENFDIFVMQLNGIITEINQDFPLTQTCIADYRIPNSIPQDINPYQYTQDVAYNRTSLVRDLVERYHLEISSSFEQLLQSNPFDLIFINSIASWSMIERFSLDKSPIICQFSDILSCQYALNNQREIDLSEYALECQLLNRCQVLLVEHDYELEKIQEKVTNPKSYLMPSDNQKQTQISLESCYSNLMDEVCYNLLKDKALPQKAEHKKIAILYPWGDILERKSGASKRVGLLVDYLKLQSYQVWVFTTGEEKDFRQDNIHYTYYQQSYENYCLVKDIYADAYQSWEKALELTLKNQTNKSKISDESNHWLPWIYYQYRFDNRFIKKIEQIAEWADIILLEYPFWASIVGQICHQYKTKLIITAHDILCQQLDDSTFLGKIALTEEIEGLKQANHLICVSENDQDFLSQYGLDSEVIPNPINLDLDQYIDRQKEDKKLLKKLEKNELKLSNKPFCLFVGSQHLPNLEAVSNIRQMAQDFSEKYPNIACNFIVVGSCCQPEHQQNFFSLGQVESSILSFLYHHASLIISPLLSGTGISVKIVEAMAYGKVILGTSVAFRGYPIKSQQEAIICDHLSDYPTHIATLITNSQQTQKIGQNAAQFAQNYDYRSLYQLYKKLIES